MSIDKYYIMQMVGAWIHGMRAQILNNEHMFSNVYLEHTHGSNTQIHVAKLCERPAYARHCFIMPDTKWYHRFTNFLVNIFMCSILTKIFFRYSSQCMCRHTGSW
jgi:hypothetical protein